MTTIEELAETIQATHDLDTRDAARDVVQVHVDQIADDPDLWNAEAQTLTAAGVTVVTEVIEQSYAASIHGTRAQRLLDELSDAVVAIAQAKSEVDAHTERRDELIREALTTELSRNLIASIAQVKPARLYQIRDGRR